MARLVIATYPDDVHAVEVALALDDLGHDVVLWHGGDFPTLQAASLAIDGRGARWDASGPELALGSGAIDAVWYRRPTRPALPGGLHPGDLPVAQRECEDFVDGLWHLAAPQAFWVNPLEGRRRASLKAVQLSEACACGLEVPRTLMSNDPARIRAFLSAHPEGTVFKPFYPAQWEHHERVAVQLTSEVRAQDLPEDAVLRLTPGIFQPKLEKAYELRVTWMGGVALTARLRSQESSATRLDWRERSVDLRVEPAVLPDGVSRACRRLMERLGLVFGCLDLVVTPDGRHVFLEVNPMGQFLWVEDACPELPLLDAFCRFLAARGSSVRAEPPVVRHRDYFQAALARIEATRGLHVTRTESYVSSDAPAATASAVVGTGEADPRRATGGSLTSVREEEEP